jgi:hypothetical protein
MYEVTSDTDKNRLYITLGELSSELIKPILKDLAANVTRLKPDFTCLVDIRKMSVDAEAKGIEYIEIIQGALSDAGMKQVIRVVNEDNIQPYKKMDNSSQALGYPSDPATTIEEAEKILDKA